MEMRGCSKPSQKPKKKRIVYKMNLSYLVTFKKKESNT